VPTSIEKVHDYARQLQEGPPPADAGPAELALRTLLMTTGPMLLAQLPGHAEDFDELLERGALALLRLRSDDAPALEVGFSSLHKNVGEQVAAEQQPAERHAGIEPGDEPG
jgi:hypothetical protein